MMKTSYRLVVFDWEGTLGDTLGSVLNALEYESRQLQLGVFDERLARRLVVLGMATAIKKLFPNASLYQQEQLLEAVQLKLSTASAQTYLFPGIKPLLNQMHQMGFELAIATNKGAHSLQRVLQETQLNKVFAVTRAAGQVPAKPCPQMLYEIMDAFGRTASETVMIGDSVADIEMAALAGVDAIGVDFYHQQKASLLAAGALFVCDDEAQLAQYFLDEEEAVHESANQCT